MWGIFGNKVSKIIVQKSPKANTRFLKTSFKNYYVPIQNHIHKEMLWFRILG